MGYKIRNFIGSEGNDDIHVADQKGSMTAFYYDRDLSVMPWNAQTAYFAAQMNIRKRQLLCQVGEKGIICQAHRSAERYGEDRREHGHRLVLGLTVHHGTLRKKPLRKRRFRGRPGQCLPGYWKDLDGAGGGTGQPVKQKPEKKKNKGG